MKERIIEFLKAENKTSAQFAEDIGVQPSGISHILSGRNKPSLDFVIKMLEKYKYLSTEWLLFGKGTMYKEPGIQNLFEKVSDGLGLDGKPEKTFFEGKESIKTGEKPEIPDRKVDSTVEKIVCFYSNNSFREYFPGGE